MRKLYKIVSLAMVCLLVSCVEAEKVRTHNFKEQYVIEGRCEHDIYVNVFEDKGHTYRFYWFSMGKGSTGVVHDPDCPCHNKKK